MDKHILAESLRGTDDMELAHLERLTSRWEREERRDGDAILAGLWHESLIAIRREMQRRARPPRRSRADFSMDARLGGAA